MACLLYSNFGLFSTKNYKIRCLLQEPIRCSVISNTCAYVITEKSDLVVLGIDNLSPGIFWTSVRQVSCNNNVLYFITTDGVMYSVGDDCEKFGLLGVRNCYSSKNPILVIVDGLMCSVSVGHSQVAGLGENGELYTWGSGAHGELGNCLFGERQLPTLVQNAKIFMIRQVLCGKDFTAFCTAGGFLFIYGQLPSSPCGIKKQKSPYTIPSLRSSFITHLTSCNSFLVLFSDNKEIFILDSCLELNKLPKKYSKVACSSDSLIAISKKEKLIHEFRPHAKSHCRAGDLNCKIFILEELFTDKISLFSGSHVSYHLKSEKIKGLEMNLQYLTQNRYKLESNVGFPIVKPILANLFGVLANRFEVFLRSSFAYLKFFVKCKNLREKDTLNLVLLSILNNLRMRCLIYKKNALNRMRGFCESCKKRRKSKEFKRFMILQQVLRGKISKIFAAILDGLENSESYKVKKIRITEKIFSKLSLNTNNNLKKGFITIKKHSTLFTKAKEKLRNLCNLVEKSQKILFFTNLVNISVIRAKLSSIINKILGFSVAKNSRLQILKHFHGWKRQIVSSKIAAISQKYARSIKTKKITEKLKQLTRTSLKLGFFSLKLHTRSPFNALKLTFFLKIFNIFFNCPKKLSFKLIKTFSKAKKSVQHLCKKLFKSQFKQILQAFSSYLKKRKIFQLMKVFSFYQTKLYNQDLKKVYRAFCMLKKSERKSLSPDLSPSAIINCPFVQAKSEVNGKKVLNLVNSIDFSKLKPKSPSNLQDFLQKFGKKDLKDKKNLKKTNAHTPGVQRGIKKMMTSSARQHKDRLDRSFNDSFLSDEPIKIQALSPQPKQLSRQPKQLSPWESQLMALAQSLIFSIYKSHLSKYLKTIINR